MVQIGKHNMAVEHRFQAPVMAHQDKGLTF
jgi:hypothetical protein